MTESSNALKTRNKFLILIAWVVTLLVSLLPDILFRELAHQNPAWLYWAKLGVTAVLLLICLFWKRLKELRLFAAVLLAVLLLDYAVGRIYLSLGYSAWLGRPGTFIQNVGSVEIPRFTEALLLIPILLLLTRNARRFFLSVGKLDAIAAPIPLVMTRPSNWKILGPAIAGAMMLGLAVFSLVFGSLPTMYSLKGLLPLMPFVLLFALANSFGEEMLYRVPWLGALENPVGAVPALLMTSVYFGIGHFYGVPYGVLGVVLAFIPGWLMGKSVLETRGIAWAWFIHFWMDVVIFAFVAMGSLMPGG